MEWVRRRWDCGQPVFNSTNRWCTKPSPETELIGRGPRSPKRKSLPTMAFSKGTLLSFKGGYTPEIFDDELSHKMRDFTGKCISFASNMASFRVSIL